MKKSIKTKRYEEAIRILEEGKFADKEYRGLVQSFSNKKKYTRKPASMKNIKMNCGEPYWNMTQAISISTKN